MRTQRRAVIDIGTNSIKLLVAEVAGVEVRPVLEKSHQTRLGQGLYQTHSLAPERIEHSARTVSEFASQAREQKADSIRVIATSAAREARNADQLAAAILAASGLHMEIISGDAEAELAFRGINADPTLTDQPVLLLETGGGSTQFILGSSGHAHFLQSFAIGAVRLVEQFPHSNPPAPAELEACRAWLKQYLDGQVRPQLAPLLERERAACQADSCVQLVGTGGTASILGCMEAQLDHFDRACLDATRLTIERLRWHVQHLWSLSLEKRKHIVGLPHNRADIILTGAAIYEAVMLHLGFPDLRISTRGLRFGAVQP